LAVEWQGYGREDRLPLLINDVLVVLKVLCLNSQKRIKSLPRLLAIQFQLFKPPGKASQGLWMHKSSVVNKVLRLVSSDHLWQPKRLRIKVA
jgi:hypothetical protein